MQYLHKMIGVVKDIGKERLKYWDRGIACVKRRKYIIWIEYSTK